MLRRSPRVVALWAAALTIGTITTVVVADDLATLHRRAGAIGPERDAVVATHALAIGTTVKRSDVRVRRVHGGQLPPGVISSLDDVLARVVAVPVVSGGFVADANLAPRRRLGLDGVVPPGMRAMRIVVTNAVRAHPGDSVDVLATFDSRTGISNTAGSPSTTVLASGVLVVAADSPSSASTRTDALGVTVLVDPQQAQRLAYGEANAVLTITLVPPEDSAFATRPDPGRGR